MTRTTAARTTEGHQRASPQGKGSTNSRHKGRGREGGQSRVNGNQTGRTEREERGTRDQRKRGGAKPRDAGAPKRGGHVCDRYGSGERGVLVAILSFLSNQPYCSLNATKTPSGDWFQKSSSKNLSKGCPSPAENQIPPYAILLANHPEFLPLFLFVATAL